MRKIAFVLVAGTFLGGCVGPFGGCGSSKAKEIAEASESFDVENYRLTDADVEKLIRDLPDLAGDLKKLGTTVENTPTDFGKYLAAQAGGKALLAKLRAKGWNPPEKFFVVLTRAVQAYLAAQAGEAMASHKKEMEELLKNPNIPKEQKELIRQQLGEMGKAQEEFRDDIEVVKRHMDDLKEALESLE